MAELKQSLARARSDVAARDAQLLSAEQTQTELKAEISKLQPFEQQWVRADARNSEYQKILDNLKAELIGSVADHQTLADEVRRLQGMLSVAKSAEERPVSATPLRICHLLSAHVCCLPTCGL
jgi:hypothetical protein